MKQTYHFPSPYDVANFFVALGLFTMADFGTSVFDCREAIVEWESEQDGKLIAAYAEQYHGRIAET